MRKIAMLLLCVAAEFGVVASAHAAGTTTAPKIKTPPPPPPYTVVSGDSLSSIATANNLTSWMPIWDANTNLQNPDQITPGQQLIMPTAPYPTTDRPLPAGYGAPVPVAVAAAAAILPVASRPASANVQLPGGLAQRVCARESGCNYAENTGNGYYGAYQFDSSTWGGFGGYAEANLAPPSVQDAKFQADYAARGCSPWPNTCF